MSASGNAGAIPGSPMPQGTSPWNNAMYASRNFFTYETDLLTVQATLTPGNSAQLAFNIAGDSDFFWTKFAVCALVGGAASSINGPVACSLLLTNTTTGRQYSSSATPLSNMAGTGQLPFILPQITMWQRKSTITAQILNVSADTTYSNIFLSFLGIKAFPTAANS